MTSNKCKKSSDIKGCKDKYYSLPDTFHKQKEQLHLPKEPSQVDLFSQRCHE